MSRSLLGSKRLQPLWVDFRKRQPPRKPRLDLHFLGGRLREVCQYFAIYLFISFRFTWWMRTLPSTSVTSDVWSGKKRKREIKRLITYTKQSLSCQRGMIISVPPNQRQAIDALNAPKLGTIFKGPSFVINHFFFGHLHGNVIIERSCLLEYIRASFWKEEFISRMAGSRSNWLQ